MKLTFFSDALFTMRLDEGSFVYSEGVSLSMISSATMIKDALHFIYVRPLCSEIA